MKTSKDAMPMRVESTRELTDEERIADSMAVLDELRKPTYRPETRLAAASETIDRIVGKPIARNITAEVSASEIDELKQKCSEILASQDGEFEARLVRAQERKRAFEASRAVGHSPPGSTTRHSLP